MSFFSNICISSLWPEDAEVKSSAPYRKHTGLCMFAKLGIYNQKTTKLKSEYFLLDSMGAWYNIGVKVPFTSSLSVYAKVLAHNLNDIRNRLSFSDWLITKDMLVFAFNFF